MPDVEALRWAIYAEALKPSPGSIAPDAPMPDGLEPVARLRFAQARQAAADVRTSLYPLDEEPDGG